MVFAGMPGLHRLIYVSRHALMAGDADAALGEIVHQSVHHNRNAAVTGFLMSHDGWFIQVLEGPGDKVRQTFDVIRQDPRHRDVTEVSYEKVTDRLFADWDMCAHRLSDGDDVILTYVGPGFDPRAYSTDQILSLLNNVADQQRAALAA